MRKIDVGSKIKLFAGFGILALSSLIVYAAMPPVATILGNGINADMPLMEGPGRVTARHLVTPAGDVGGWHYHPGYVQNVVTQGTIKIEDGCGAAPSYSAGQAFETSEGRVHRAINESTTVDAVEYNMFVGPVGRPLGVPIPGNVRRCGPASNVDECGGDGWEAFDFPDSFKNQGQCIAFVNQRRRVTLLVPEDPLRP